MECHEANSLKCGSAIFIIQSSTFPAAAGTIELGLDKSDGRTHFQSARLSSSGRLQLPLAHHFTSELAKYLWGDEIMLDVEVALCTEKS
jgi:succinylarginine dihydrolase